MERLAFEYFLDFELQRPTSAEILDTFFIFVFFFFFRQKQNCLQLCLWLQQQNICGVLLYMILHQDHRYSVLFVWVAVST